MSRVCSFLDLRYTDGRVWVLDHEFIAISDIVGRIVVKAGERTDFNSIPRGLWNLFPPDQYGEAAVLHDHLYKHASAGGHVICRRQADEVHREFLRFRHAPDWKVAVMFAGLRACGWVAWNRYRRQERDS